MLLSNFGWTGGGTGGGGGSGTVTLITASTGMNFSPITTTGGIAIDTTQVPYFSGGFGAGGLARFSAGVWSFDTNTYLTAATLTGLDVTNALGYTPVNKAGDTMGGYLILNADPISPLGAATKQYVDNISGGINFHEATYAASTTNLVANYNNGTSGVGATLTATSNGALILDGVDFSLLLPPTQPYRVLIWQQTNQIENGIYVVTSAGSPTSTWQLTRASDADNSPTGELAFGDFSLNLNGNLYGGYGFIMNATGTINIGLSNITYVQYNLAQAITAGTGLTELPANTLNIDTNQVPYYSGGFGVGGFAIYSGGNWTFDTNTYLTTSAAAATYLTITNASTTYVPYTGASGNVNLGVYNLTTPLIYGSTIASSNLTLSSTSDVTKGKIIFGTSAYDEVNNRLGIGTTTPAEKLTVSGNIIANLLTNLGYVKIYDDATFNYIESDKPTLLKTTGNNALRMSAGGSFSVQTDGSGANKLTIATSNSSPNSVTQFTSTLFAQANCQASTEVRSVLFSGIGGSSPTKTWLNGNIDTQRWFHITANTAQFTSAPSSTITNSYALYVEAAIAGTNAIITNNYAAGFLGNVIIRDALTPTNPPLLNGDLEVHKVRNGDVVAVVRNDWQGASNIAAAALVVRSDSTTQLRVSMTSNNYATAGLITAGTANLTTGGTSANRMLIGHASGTKDIIFVNGGTGAVNEIFRISQFNSIDIFDARNLTFGTTTGTKFGTSTSQKISFFNATPIVQPPAVTTLQGLVDALGSATGLGLVATSTLSSYYALYFGHTNENFNLTPQTLCFGNNVVLGMLSLAGQNDSRRVVVPRSGLVTDVTHTIQIGTLGSNEFCSLVVANVTAGTTSIASSTVQFNAQNQAYTYTLASPLVVSAGDKIELRVVTSGFVTAPQTVKEFCNVVIRC